MKHQSLLKWCMAVLMAIVSSSTASAAKYIKTHIEPDGIQYDLYDDNTAVVKKPSWYIKDAKIAWAIGFYTEESNYTEYKEYEVTSINHGAFSGCTFLQTVEMNGVTSIGDQAFEGCTSLESVKMNSVTSIGQEAFSGCSSLKSITLLNANPPTCGKDAFPSYGNFIFFVPRDSKLKYKSTTWGKTFIFKSYGADKRIVVTTTAGQLMEKIDIDNISQIWDIKISGEINGTDLNIINRMKNLENLDLSDCRIMSGGASYYKNDNKDYYTGDDVLDSYAIRLANLDSISYPRVKSIRLEAVSITPRLYYAVIPATVTSFGCHMPCCNYIFEYGDEGLAGQVYGAKKVLLGRLVNSNKFFDEVKTDSKVVSTLEEVVIAYPYTEFKSSFFRYCTKLASFKIPASVQIIEPYVFWNCYRLKEVICCAQTPPRANADSFDESTYKDATLYVPVGTRNAYFFDPVWGMFGNIVESEELTNGVGDLMTDDVDGPVSVYDLLGIQRYHGERDAMPTLPRGVYIIRYTNGKAEKVKF